MEAIALTPLAADLNKAVAGCLKGTTRGGHGRTGALVYICKRRGADAAKLGLKF